jgi:hypothetical protein
MIASVFGMLTSGPLGNWLAPALSAALLLAAATFDLVGVESADDSAAFHAEVRAAIEGVPYKIGPWVGRDVEAAAAATQLLQPIKMMQRRFSDPSTGRSFSLLIVYCGDTRDMLGHYPPVCYPAHGWLEEDEDQTSFELGQMRYPARTYRFRRSVAGVDQSMTIFNFFALPMGEARLVADMRSVNRASQTRAGVGLGAGQFQLLFGEGFEPAERAEITQAVLETLRPVLETITAGAQA